jgi:hypothetical protein
MQKKSKSQVHPQDIDQNQLHQGQEYDDIEKSVETDLYAYRRIRTLMNDIHNQRKGALTTEHHEKIEKDEQKLLELCKDYSLREDLRIN